VRVRRLPFRDAVIDLEVSGAGWFLEKLEVNGLAVKGTRKIPAGLLAGDVKIVCRRTETAPDHPAILSLHGATVHAVELVGETLRAEVSGYGAAWLEFFSSAPPQILRDGTAVHFTASGRAGIYRALLELRENARVRIEIASVE